MTHDHDNTTLLTPTSDQYSNPSRNKIADYHSVDTLSQVLRERSLVFIHVNVHGDTEQEDTSFDSC